MNENNKEKIKITENQKIRKKANINNIKVIDKSANLI